MKIRSLKISQKLKLAIIVQLIFIGILISGLIYVTISLKNESESRSKYALEINEINDLTLYVKDFVNNRISFEELKKIFTDVSKNIYNKETLNKVNEILLMNEEIHNLRTKNIDLEDEFMKITNLSLQQSNGYLETISQRLADRNEREKVSVLERLVIGGATNNTNNVHKLRQYFLKMKGDITVKDELIAFLEDFNTQTLKDIENLKNTDFEDMVKQAAKSNEQTMKIIKGYAENTYKTSTLANDIYEIGTALHTEMDEESISSLNKGFNKIEGQLKTTYIILLIFSIGLIMLNYSLSKLITFVFKQLSTDLNKVASGDLTFSIPDGFEKRTDELGDIARSIKKVLDNLKKIIGNIRNGAEYIASASQEISSSSQQMSQGANEQATSVEEVSSTMEEISANIQQNAQNAQATETISQNAQNGILEVSGISQKAQAATKEISSKIQIINDIAFQTNILALNAAVEAARAGEHGKGFAVVASEVRKLAERSREAAESIVSLAQDSLLLADNVGQQMSETLPEVTKTTNLVQEISSASVEQRNGVEQVNSAIQQLNNVVQQSASASEQLATNSEELASQADSLKDLVAYFRLNSESNDKVNVSPLTKKQNSILSKSSENQKSVLKKQNKVSDEKDIDFENF